MKEEKKFNQNEYVNEYKKKHYSPLKINLKKEEKEELDKLLAEEGLTQTQFIRNAIADLKAKKKEVATFVSLPFLLSTYTFIN